MSALGSRNLFLLGALVGVLSGVVLGSVATIELGDKVASLFRHLARKISDRKQSVRFELLGQ